MIALERIHANAGGGAFELCDISFTLPAGEYGIVVGPAGAGKTTLLETIAGIVPASSGRLVLGGHDVTRAPPEARRLGIVYQHAYLFPHLTVRQNVAYGAGDTAAVDDMTSRFGIAGFADRTVESLSGGERQLVALARALAGRPDVLLLDEPFSALDPRTRASARRTLRALYAERRFTVLQVTHDFAEAGLLGDVVIVLDKGRVVQQGEPAQVFRRPASPYIADFLGAENVFAGHARPIDARSSGEVEHEVSHAQAVAFTTGALTFYALGDAILGEAGGPAHAVIRAEEISLAAQASASSVQNQFRGKVVEIVPTGALSRVTIDASGTPLVAAVTARSVRELGLDVGSDVVAAFKAMAVHLC